jgi:hypothetical protein
MAQCFTPGARRRQSSGVCSGFAPWCAPDHFGIFSPQNSLLAYYPGVMTKTDAERFRKEAEECRELAAKAISQLDREAWLRLAADWIKLAQSAEERRGF